MQLTGRGPITARGYGRPGVGERNLPPDYEYIRDRPPPEPYPELGAAVRDAHAAEVLAASERLGTDDPDVLADALYLHPFNVRRALGGDGFRTRPAAPAGGPRGARLDRAAAFLRGLGRPATTAEIAAAVGCHTTALALVLKAETGVFRRAGFGTRSAKGGLPPILWELRSKRKTLPARRTD